MDFGNAIKMVRLKCLLSQDAFAKELGVSYSTVNRWETGKTLPNYKAMNMINDFCKNRKIAFDISDKLFSNSHT